MTLGRIIQMIDGEKCSVIKPRWLTKIFVIGDVLSFLMQASGKCSRLSAFCRPRPAGLLQFPHDTND